MNRAYPLGTLPSALAWLQEHSGLVQIHCRFATKFRKWNQPKGHLLCRCPNSHRRLRKSDRVFHSVQPFDCQSKSSNRNVVKHTVLLKHVNVVMWRGPWARVISGTNSVVIFFLCWAYLSVQSVRIAYMGIKQASSQLVLRRPHFQWFWVD